MRLRIAQLCNCIQLPGARYEFQEASSTLGMLKYTYRNSEKLDLFEILKGSSKLTLICFQDALM